LLAIIDMDISMSAKINASQPGPKCRTPLNGFCLCDEIGVTNVRAPVFTVSSATPGVPVDGKTIAGVTEQLPACGTDPHVSETGLLKPATEVIVTAKFALWPALTVADPGITPMVKSGVAARPVPLKFTICGLPGALSRISIAADSAPPTDGV
jgi:hypothetical protein